MAADPVMVRTGERDAHRGARARGRSSERRREARIAGAMLAPALLLIVVVAFIPALQTIWLSLHDATVTHTGPFTGLENYQRMFQDPAFRTALSNTAIFTVASVSLELVAGMAIALVMHQHFRGRPILRASVLVPWAFPVVISGLVWRLMLQDQVGIVAHLANSIGVVSGPILSDKSALMVAVILVDAWQSTPFMALLLLAGLQTIPREVFDAARVDGASAVQRFFQITLPLLKPALLVALLFRTLQSWSVYDLFWVMTGRQLDSLSTYVYEGVRVSSLNFATGTAAAVFVFLTAIVLALVFIKLFGARTIQEDD